MADVIELFLLEDETCVYAAYSEPWILMAWWCKEPGPVSKNDPITEKKWLDH